MLPEAIQTYQQAIQLEPNFPEAYNNLGNALRESNRMEEAMQCYTICIQLQYKSPQAQMLNRVPGSIIPVQPNLGTQQQAQRLSVAYNNLGGILKMQVWPFSLVSLSWSSRRDFFEPCKLSTSLWSFQGVSAAFDLLWILPWVPSPLHSRNMSAFTSFQSVRLILAVAV